MFACKYFYENLLLQNLRSFSANKRKKFWWESERKKNVAEKMELSIYVRQTITKESDSNWSMHSKAREREKQRERERSEEKHENEIIEIKMILNITHGATFVHTTKCPIQISRFIYFHWPHFFPCFSASQTPFTMNGFQWRPNSQFFLFVRIVTFYKSWQDNILPLQNCDNNQKNSIVTVSPVHNEKSHVVQNNRRYVN